VLVAQKAVSQAELDKALSAESAGKAGMDANQAVLDNAMLNLGWTTVVAPISGIAGISKCQIGDLMTPITAADNHIQRELIYVDINIAEQNYIRFVREKQAARQPKI
jgi:membrane fusion protein (multidrug efflux system)